MVIKLTEIVRTKSLDLADKNNTTTAKKKYVAACATV